MKRREFVRMAAGTAAVSSIPGVLNGQATGGSSSPRPNIFMIFTDDTTQRDHGCYGNEYVRTPNIDRFAQEGMLFENMVTPAPMCGPSRAALHTGLNPIRNGAHPNHSSVRPGMKSMAHYMQALGYRVILLGKQHLKPKEYFPYEYRDKVLGHRKHGKEIGQILRDPGDKPLCIIMNHFETHWSFDHGQDEYPYEPDEVEIPPYLVDTPETREQRARYFSEVTFMDNAVGDVLKLLENTGMVENTLTIYASDHGSHWPREKWNMYDTGIKLPFIARWPGKIKAGTRTDALASLVDIIPTFIDIAGGDVDQVVSDCGGEPLDGRSLLPVMLGEKEDVQQEIFALMTFGVTNAYPIRAVRTKTHKYIWNIDSHFIFPDYWARELPQTPMEWEVWSSWERKAATAPATDKLVRSILYRPPVEFYALRNDPFELNNLADDPEQAGLLASLRAKLDAWMLQQGDDGSSAYHLEEGHKHKLMDEIFSRQVVVQAKMIPAGHGIAFEESAWVELSSPVWAARIHYTLDGSEPTQDSPRFEKRFQVQPPVVIKAKGFFDGGETPMNEIDFREWGCFAFYANSWYKPNYSR